VYKKMAKTKTLQKKRRMDKILVADDSKKIRLFLKTVLEKEGHDVVIAKSGEQVLDRLKTEAFSVATLYLGLSGINGTKLLNKIRQISPETEIVIITTSASIKKAIKIIAMMSLEYIIDPFNATEVRVKITRVIDRQRVSVKNKKLIEELKGYRKKLSQRILVTDKRLQRSNVQLKHAYRELKTTYDNLARDRQKTTSINKELTDKINKLTILDQMGIAVRQTIRLEERLRIVANNINKGIGIDRTTIMLFSKGKKILRYAGTSEGGSFNIGRPFSIILSAKRGVIGKAVFEKKIYNVKSLSKRQYINKKIISRLNLKKFVVVPLIAKDDAIGIIIVDNPTTKRSITMEDVKSLRLFAGQAAIAIENSQLYEEILEENVRNNKDLKMAYNIQCGLLPKEYPKLAGIKIWARSQPARVVGGDFYFFRRFRKEDRKLGIVIGDVAGKGVPAALVMAMTASAIEEFSRGRSVLPQKVISKVNKSVMQHIPKDADIFITAFYSIIDLEENTFIYTKAGHSPPLLFDGVKDVPLEAKGPPLGEFKDSSFEDNQVRISPGMKIVFYTDGITETRSRTGKMFGLDRLRELIAKHIALSPKELGEKVFKKVERFRGREIQADDSTLIIIEIENKKEG